jgi:hypothetical protein
LSIVGDRWRSLSIVFLVITGGSSAWGTDNGFSTRFEEIKASASDEELYRFLYALPKGGDLHNHLGGSSWPEWWYRIATDRNKTRGNSFYTRTKIPNLRNNPDPLLSVGVKGLSLIFAFIRVYSRPFAVGFSCTP